MQAKWKRYPNRSGAMRFQAYFVDVEVVDRETREVPKLQENGEGGYDRVIASEDWVKIRFEKRLRWIPAKELVNP